MTVDRAWPLEQAVFARCLAGADPGFDVINTIPSPVPERYIRIDGFSAIDRTRYKTGDRMEHSFVVHAFARDDKSKNWPIAQIRQIDAELKSALLDGAGDRVRLETYNSTFDKDLDGGHTAHAYARYSVRIGA